MASSLGSRQATSSADSMIGLTTRRLLRLLKSLLALVWNFINSLVIEQPGAILFHKDFVFDDGSFCTQVPSCLGNTDVHLVVAKTLQRVRTIVLIMVVSGKLLRRLFADARLLLSPKKYLDFFSDFYEIKLAQLKSKIVSGRCATVWDSQP